MEKYIEIQRNNVTVAEFLRYIRQRCEKKGLSFDLSREDFESPRRHYLNRYSCTGNKRHDYNADGGMRSKMRPVYAEARTESGRLLSLYKTGELEVYEEYEVVFSEKTEEFTEDNRPPCKAETCKSFPYDHQMYILNWDGSCYNEIIEFTFDDDKRGSGYYYQMHKEADAVVETAEVLHGVQDYEEHKYTEIWIHENENIEPEKNTPARRGRGRKGEKIMKYVCECGFVRDSVPACHACRQAGPAGRSYSCPECHSTEFTARLSGRQEVRNDDICAECGCWVEMHSDEQCFEAVYSDGRAIQYTCLPAGRHGAQASGKWSKQSSCLPTGRLG
jgi:hypothetical protein